MKKWQSGKFWLKTLCALVIGALGLGISSQAILYRHFSPEALQRAAEAHLAESGRRIRFDAHISRSFFPRPTVTLRNVIITEPHQNKTAIYIKEMRTGIAWASLWSNEPEIEKWVWIEPDIYLRQTNTGQWNVQDLLNRRGAHINRLIIEKGRIQIDTPVQHHLINAFKIKTSNLSSAEAQFEASGNSLQPSWQPITWRAQGLLQQREQGWAIPNFNLSGRTQLWQHPLHFTLTTALENQAGTLKTGPLKYQLASPKNQLNLNIESSSAEWNQQRLRLNETNAIATAHAQNQDWSGSFSVHQLIWRPTIFTADQIQLKASHQTADYFDTLTLNTALSWQSKQGFQLNGLSVSTRQDSRKNAAQTRFISQLEGSLKSSDSNRWQAKLSGQIDRQPASIFAEYQHQPQSSLTASIYLKKLSLSPYWNELFSPTEANYPAALAHDKLAQLSADLKIDTLTTPLMQADDFNVHIEATAQQIQFSSLSAGLYGGHTEGGLSISNAQPPTLHVQQYFQNIQINPLLDNVLGFRNLSGRGDAVIDLTSKIGKRAQWLSSLNGRASINVNRGSLEGLDFAKILQNLRNNQTQHPLDNHQQTPFERFSLDTLIEQGISQQSHSELISGNVTVTSSGKTDFNRQTLQENVTISVRNQNHLHSIPLQINGTFNQPAITLDYQRLTKGLSTPQQKQQALANALKEQWQWFKSERSASEAMSDDFTSGSPP